MSNTRPGVEVEQKLSASSSTAASPALVPCVVGPCYQIVPALDSEGALNADALYEDENYNQAALLITQASLPDPRSNIDEINVDEASVKTYLKYGGSLSEIPRGSNDSFGQSFLKACNFSTKAAFRSSVSNTFNFSSTGDPLILCFDIANPEDASEDYTITLSGTYTDVQVLADDINEAVGSDVASVYTPDSGVTNYLHIESTVYGVSSSITLRAGAAALTVLFGAGFDDSIEYRIEGSGFRGQDDEDGDLTTPWIEFYRGAYFEADVEVTDFPGSSSAPTANKIWVMLMTQAAEAQYAKSSAITFTGAGADVPLSPGTTEIPGDQFWADGTKVKSAQVIKAESSRFKLGTLNNKLSTFDNDGNPTNRVYDTVEVNTIYHGTPFAPKYAYFRADGLVFGDISPIGVQAALTGSNTGLASRQAIVQGTAAMTFPINLAGLTLLWTLTEDGVQAEQQTYTFAGGPFANMADLLAAVDGDFTGLVVVNSGDRLAFKTTKYGADQAISIASQGTANTALHFSTSAATTDTGKDVEFATQSVLTSAAFTLPVGTELSGKTFELTVIDAKGTHVVSGAMGSNPATTSALINALSACLGGDGVNTIADGVIQVASISTSAVGDAVQVVITTVEGGAAVSLSITATDETDGFRYLGFYDGAGDESAVLVADTAVTDFIELRGHLVVGANTGFSLAVAGIPVPFLTADVDLNAFDYNFDELAAGIAAAITAAIAGGGNPVATCAYDRVTGFFSIGIAGATLITIGPRSAPTSIDTDVFGTGYTAAQAAATWTGITPDLPFPLIELTVTDGDGAHAFSTAVTLPMVASAIGGDNTSAAGALVDILNATAALHTDGGKRRAQYLVDSANKINIRSVLGGAGVSAEIAAAQAGFIAMGFDSAGVLDAGAASDGNADDSGADGLKGNPIGFYLDECPTVFAVTFTTNSLSDAVDDINTLVGASTDVASESSGALVLTSTLAGAASSVTMNVTSPYDVVAGLFGLSGSAVGSGRPNPDFYLDVDGSVNIGGMIIRSTTSGVPFSIASGVAKIYIAYTALRLDVSAMADNASMLTFASTADMEDAIGPISVDNPLCLGTFLALLNSPANEVSCFGIDEVNDAAPTGTIDAWARALDFLESREIYALAPLSADEYVTGLVSTHVQTMSMPANRMERIALLWLETSTRAENTTVISGEAGLGNGTDNSFTLDESPSAALAALGVADGAIEYDSQLYLEILITDGGSTELRRYSVSNVNNTVLSLRTTFAADENTDSFFSTTTLSGSLAETEWTLFLRGEELLVSGTTRTDLGAVATASAAQGEAIAHRRVYLFFCASVDTSVDGLTKNVPGYYACAAVAGMIGQQNPQQPFTNVAITGIGKVYGTDDTFSEKQMDTIADGGRYILVNQGGRVASRHSRSTATTSIEERELSITKSIDWLAKGLRQTNRVFIGRYVITPNFMDQLSMSNQGFLKYAVNLGVVAAASLSDILQSEDEPDTILIEVEATPAYPCNKIKITIVT